MGLKQSIVIVNEFTVKTGSKGGTRGGTPGNYVLRYMARDGATEDLTPVRFEDTEMYITRYMARKEATETLDSIPEIKKEMRDIQGFGGVAFGNDDLSMSHVKVRAVSRDIQRQFENGKTVLKTVISFDEDYLRKFGIIKPEFTCRKRGDFRGNVDQMKLRLAISEGIAKMSRDYDNLEWIGVIQVDTKHLHCHLCMVDKGVGNLAKDGTQKGKISEKSKRTFRRAVNDFLSENQRVKMMSSNITQDRRNVKCFIKKFAHETMAQHGTPQFLLSCLPADRRLWRASTNREEMAKANQIVREYVEQVFKEPDSGYKNAMREIGRYAQERQKVEDLSTPEYRSLITNGRKRLVEDCMNGVYSVLKQIPESELQVRTPMLDVMSMNYGDMAAQRASDPMIEFGFKLRSYSSRLQHHRKERDKYHDYAKSYEDAKARGEVSADSAPLYNFYKFEEDYNARLMCKYQHFLSFIPPDKEYEDDFNDIMEYRRKMRNLRAMRDDKAIKRMSDAAAEDYGKRVYDMRGGHFVNTAPQVFDRRLDLMNDTYETMVDDFKYKLAGSGLTLEIDANGVRVSKEKPFEFSDVKALDLHHLGYDFPYDAAVSKVNSDMFVNVASRRYNLFQQAKNYLEGSQQAFVLRDMPVKDIEVMKEMADRFDARPVIPSAKPVSKGGRHNGQTIRLDNDYTTDMKLAIKATVQSVQFGND